MPAQGESLCIFLEDLSRQKKDIWSLAHIFGTERSLRSCFHYSGFLWKLSWYLSFSLAFLFHVIKNGDNLKVHHFHGKHQKEKMESFENATTTRTSLSPKDKAIKEMSEQRKWKMKAFFTKMVKNKMEDYPSENGVILTGDQTAEYGKCTPKIFSLKYHGTLEFGCGSISIVWSFYFATATTNEELQKNWPKIWNFWLIYRLTRVVVSVTVSSLVWIIEI